MLDVEITQDSKEMIFSTSLHMEGLQLSGPAHKAVSLDRVSKPTLQKGFDTHHEHL